MMEWITLSLPFLIFTCAVRPIAKACATQDALLGEFPGVNWICLRPAAMQLQESSPVVTRIAVMCLLDRREIICKLLPITRLGRPERKFEHSFQLPWPLLHRFCQDVLADCHKALNNPFRLSSQSKSILLSLSTMQFAPSLPMIRSPIFATSIRLSRAQ